MKSKDPPAPMEPASRKRIPTWIRSILRHYPIRFGKGFLANVLSRRAELPDGEIVQSKEGIRIRIHPDWMYCWLYYYGEYEPETTAVFKRIIRPGDVCFDIGANLGYFTCIFSKLGAEVYAFEPLPSNFAFNCDTVQLNGLQDRVHSVNVGLGAKSGTFTIYTFERLPHGQASATNLGRDDALPHTCSITTIDDFCFSHSINHIAFMKVDIEGHEFDCFSGGRATLSKPDAPILHFEVNRACLAHRGIEANDLLRLLTTYGYVRFCRIARGGRLRLMSDRLPNDNADYVAIKTCHIDRAASW